MHTIIGQGMTGARGSKSNVLAHGATIAIELSNPSIPNSVVSVLAMIDTGALITCIDHRVAQNLILKPKNVVTLASVLPFKTPHAAQGTLIPQYSVHLTLPAAVTFSQMIVNATDLTGFGYRCLIGRDVLGEAEFYYDGLRGDYSLQFR